MTELSREKVDQLEDKVARSEVNMRREITELSSEINMNKTLLNRRMKYIVIAVVILLVAVGYPLFNHYQATIRQQKKLQATMQQQVDATQATKFTMQQQNVDLQATKFTMQQQNDHLQATKFTMQQQVDDLQANLQQQQNLQATLQLQNDNQQATMKQQNDDIKATKFTVQQQVDDLQATLQQQNDDLQATKHQYYSMTFELTDYRKKMDNICYHSPPFYTSLKGYNMRIRVDANGHGVGEGSHVSALAYIVKGKYDDDLNWPFVGYVTIELLNQLEGKNHHSKVLNITARYNMTLFSDSSFGSQRFYSIRSLLHDSNSTTQYLKNDTLHFRISAQASGHRPWLECTTDMENEMGKKIVEVAEKNHVMTFKLPGYKEKKDSNETFTSPSFYTSPNGYNMKIEVYPNDSEGSHVSVYAQIIEGKNDNKLNWPFVGIISFELLNQQRDEDHYFVYGHVFPAKVGESRGLRYIPHSYLESNSPYLQDDTLYFRVNVDMLDPKTSV